MKKQYVIKILTLLYDIEIEMSRIKLQINNGSRINTKSPTGLGFARRTSNVQKFEYKIQL